MIVLPQWLIDLAPTAPWLVAMVIVGAVVVFIVKKIIPVARKIGHFIDDVAGEPARPGVAARPGLMERVATIESAVAEVKHEVTTNHGSSLKDAVKRLEGRLDKHIGPEVSELHEKYVKENT